MGVFREAVDDGEDDAFTMHLGETFHEVHRYVGPNLCRNVQWLKKDCGVQRLRFVALARGTSSDVVADEGTVTVDDEVRTQPVQCLLDAHMRSRVRQLEHRSQCRSCGRNEDASASQDQAVLDAPWRTARGDDVVPEATKLISRVEFLFKLAEENKRGSRQRAQGNVFRFTMRESICHRVKASEPIFH